MTRRHSRDDVLSERQFERLLQACHEFDRDEHAFEARFALHLTGKLGLRVGEAAHISADWINQAERMVEIPGHDPCSKGTDGGPCGYCRERARNHVESMNISQEEAIERVRDEFDGDLDEDALEQLAKKRREELAIDYDEAIEKWWKPKTVAGERAIPYDWDVRTELIVEEFAERYDVFPKSQSTINRRINEAAAKAGLQDNVYPHALRATAASFHAKRNVSPYSLMAILGWTDIKVARSYISSSAENAAKEVRSKHR